MLTNCSLLRSRNLLRLHTKLGLHNEVMNTLLWVSIMHGPYLNYTVRNLYTYCLWVACPCLSRFTVRALTWVVFALCFFHAHSAFWQYSPSLTVRWDRDHIYRTFISLREIFKCAHLKVTVYGRKQTSKHTHALLQCSHASVGLAQARPNNHHIEEVDIGLSQCYRTCEVEVYSNGKTCRLL